MTLGDLRKALDGLCVEDETEVLVRADYEDMLESNVFEVQSIALDRGCTETDVVMVDIGLPEDEAGA